jgi:tetratricopeptide (TPR) repeat protein
VGDWAGGGRTYGNLGRACQSQEAFSKAIEHHTQCLAIAKEVGDRAGEGRAHGNLGTCHMHLNEHVKAVAYLKAQHALAISLKLAHLQFYAALNMGGALTLHVRAARQGPSTGVDQAPGPHSHSSALACRRHWRAGMIECVRRQSGSRLSSMVVIHLQTCTWRTSPSPRGRGACTSQRARLMACATGT